MATITELAAQNSDALKAAIQAELRAMLTTLPAIIKDSDQHTATATSAILAIIRQSDGSMKQAPMPEFQTFPVHFAGGGQVVSTHPIQANDEGIIVFAARALDSWHQSGGQQPPIDARQHHASDGFYLGGIKSDPNTIPNKASNSIQHRSINGRVTHEVDPTNGTTTKVVDPSDPSTNPFSSATTFHQTIHNAVAGIVHTATDGNNLHTSTLQKALGSVLSVTSSIANHFLKLTPANGHQVSVANLVNTALHTLNLTPSGGFSATASDPAAGTSCSISALPSVVLALASSLPSGGLSLPSGGVGASALASGAASSNVGALSGDLSGTLPAASVVGAASVPTYASNAAAAAGGLAVGMIYANNTISGTEHVLCVRF